MEKKEVKLDFTNNKTNYEFASMNDIDLMRIVCFAVEEGTNLNGLTFTREVLAKTYKTFVDKPLVLVPDDNNNPQGHGFDVLSKTFDKNARKYIGHITDAVLSIVDANGLIHTVYDYEILEKEYMGAERILPDGKLRVSVECVVYQKYLQDFSSRIRALHESNELSFSMEASVDVIEQSDGTRLCVDALFTALAVVKEPACIVAKSIALAEKEEADMEFEAKFNEEVAKNEILVAEKEELVKEVGELKELVAELEAIKEELAEIKLELVEKSTVLADKEVVIAELTPFKEKVEMAEKVALAQSRAEKLTKLGVTVEDNMELAEKSKDEFANLLLEAIENYKPEATPSYQGLPVHKTGATTGKDELLEIFKVK